MIESHINEVFVRWDRWVMIVPRQISLTFLDLGCSQTRWPFHMALSGPPFSIQLHPAMCTLSNCKSRRIASYQGPPSRLATSATLEQRWAKLWFVSWPLTPHRDLCGVHMRWYTVVIHSIYIVIYGSCRVLSPSLAAFFAACLDQSKAPWRHHGHQTLDSSDDVSATKFIKFDAPNSDSNPFNII